jgi:hypothetical protein
MELGVMEVYAENQSLIISKSNTYPIIYEFKA